MESTVGNLIFHLLSNATLNVSLNLDVATQNTYTSSLRGCLESCSVVAPSETIIIHKRVQGNKFLLKTILRF